MKVEEVEDLQKLKRENDELETITNSNGTAIKYSDGTMICTLNIRVTDQAINTSMADIIYIGTRVWTFPVPFKEMPVVNCGMFKWRNWYKLGQCI